MTAWGSLTDRVMIALRDFGPMTRSELQDTIEGNKTTLGKTVGYLSKAHVRTPKRIHVSAWVSDAEGARKYPRAVYALGDMPDKPKPKRNQIEVKRRFRERQRGRMQTSAFYAGATA